MKRLLLFPVLLTAAVITGVVSAVNVVGMVRRDVKRQAETKRWAAERIGKQAEPRDWWIN